MPVVVIVGVQWGDEGKGKVVDYLTEAAKLVVRFQGGNNAGHTLVVEGRKTALQLIPSGILRPATRCLLASGVVVNPESLFEEIRRLEEIGVSVTPERLGIAPEVQLILPYHLGVDKAREAWRAKGKIGTTGKGIGPCYEDAVSREGIRICDLYSEDRLKLLVEQNVKHKNDYLALLGSSDRYDSEQILASLRQIAEKIRPYVVDVGHEVAAAKARNEFVVFEGAQGSLLDITHGTYPYVTSSNTVSSYACVSAGVGPQTIDGVVGICKAYCTRVGGGPFPTEDVGADGDTLRERGHEFGTVTGRPRRCGWFDAVAVRRAIRLNGISSIFLTKLDVLSGFDKVKLCIAYEHDGQVVDNFPVGLPDISKVKPVYEELPGWHEDISQATSYDQLPATTQAFIARLEEISGCKVSGFSVGPGRTQTIMKDSQLVGFSR